MSPGAYCEPDVCLAVVPFSPKTQHAVDNRKANEWACPGSGHQLLCDGAMFWVILSLWEHGRACLQKARWRSLQPA